LFVSVHTRQNAAGGCDGHILDWTVSILPCDSRPCPAASVRGVVYGVHTRVRTTGHRMLVQASDTAKRAREVRWGVSPWSEDATSSVE
jgi:hypothetical protein